jgi:hypothetical protein
VRDGAASCPRGEAIHSAHSAGDTATHLEACLIALRIRRPTTYAYRRSVQIGPLGLVIPIDEELMIAPHLQELIRR